MQGPLASLKVLDFSTLLPGPFASLLLADMGAEVLRIESPERPDLLRILPPHDQGTSASHAYLNRNKRSLALDLKQPAALEIIKRLLDDHDILLEQFRPGVMERLGLGYEALKAINPRLIYVSISGYGQTGPFKDRAGHDINYLALSGLASHTGRADSGPLDVSMTDCVFSLNALAGAGYLACGVKPGWENHALNGGSFYDYYRTRDGRWMSVGSLEPGFMQALCAALGRPELAAQGLAPEQQQRLKEQLRSEFEKRDFADLCALFAEVDACVEPVLELDEALEHPQLKARHLVTRVPRGDGSSQAQMACPLKFSAGLPEPRHIGARLGAHTEQVLRELGFGDEQIARLRDDRVVV
jgi:crotonobetainyl-CoA:carnitine CoA-transferase CaiB-like acyl-CoA transferase